MQQTMDSAIKNSSNLGYLKRYIYICHFFFFSWNPYIPWLKRTRLFATTSIERHGSTAYLYFWLERVDCWLLTVDCWLLSTVKPLLYNHLCSTHLSNPNTRQSIVDRKGSTVNFWMSIVYYFFLHQRFLKSKGPWIWDYWDQNCLSKTCWVRTSQQTS